MRTSKREKGRRGEKIEEGRSRERGERRKWEGRGKAVASAEAPCIST